MGSNLAGKKAIKDRNTANREGGGHSGASSAVVCRADSEKRDLFFNIPGIVYRRVNDPDWTILFISDEAERLLGYPSADFIKNKVRSFASVIHPDDRTRVSQTIQSGISARNHYVVDYRLYTQNGEVIWVRDRGRGVFSPGGTLQFLDGVIQDETNQVIKDEVLRQSELKYKNLSNQLEAILDHLPALVFYKDKNNRFIRVNKYVAQAYNKDKRELEGVSLYQLYPRDEAEKYHQDDLDVINSGVPKLNIEEPWETAEGAKWVNTSKIPFVDDEGKIIGIIGISADITERKHAEHLIQELIHRLETEKDDALQSAKLDGLTGIANRRHFDDTLNREFFRLKRNRMPLSLIMLDIDHFKKYNDRYGHLAGDDCLRLVANALQTALKRPSDVIARFGGEEFAVILPDTSGKGVSVGAERLREAIEKLDIPHEGSENFPRVTISLGVATVRPDRTDRPEKIIEMADGALYRAKHNGRNRVETAQDESVLQSIEPQEEVGFVQLVWESRDECGNPDIDRQHKRLFDTANKLLRAFIAGKDREDCLSLIACLLLETAEHFQDEEEILFSRGYPLAEEHRKKHEALIKRARELAEKYKRDELKLGELFNYLAFDVVSEHMFVEDKKFHPYVQAQT